MEFMDVRPGFDVLDLSSGPVDDFVFLMNCDDLAGVYLDYALSRCQRKYPAVEFTHRVGLIPDRVKVGENFEKSSMKLWSPTTDRDLGYEMVREFLGRELIEGEELLGALRLVVKNEFGDVMELPGYKYRTL